MFSRISKLRWYRCSSVISWLTYLPNVVNERQTVIMKNTLSMMWQVLEDDTTKLAVFCSAKALECHLRFIDQSTKKRGKIILNVTLPDIVQDCLCQINWLIGNVKYIKWTQNVYSLFEQPCSEIKNIGLYGLFIGGFRKHLF